jgi:dGTPase
MPRTRADFEEIERRDLAAYALLSGASRGRKHPEPPDPHRTDFARDRDRIVHSGAFRRLEYKTQVLVNGTGDNFRTRMTHTLEVAQIARSIGRTLQLNESLVEAVALCHDIGHPPFGHSGEEELRELMAEHGGFEHNSQALRIVDLLESPYPDRVGLNLSYELRSSLLKHGVKSAGAIADDIVPEPHPWLEAQVADAADSIAYHSHDLDDGLRFGVFQEGELGELELWRKARDLAKRRYPNASARELLRPTIHQTLQLPILDLVEETGRRLQEAGPRDALEARRAKQRLVGFSDAMVAMQAEAKRYLFKRFYFAEQVITVRSEARRVLRELFVHLQKCGAGDWRQTCDYVAGMTDRFAQLEHERLIARARSTPRTEPNR